MKKNKGQNLIEYVVIGSMVLVICIVAIIFFGDSIADLFDNNSVANLFKSKTRTQNLQKNYNYLSGVSLMFGGEKFSSPLEAKILDDINKNISTTSGAEGVTVKETVEVLLQYINQLQNILKNNPDDKVQKLLYEAYKLYSGCKEYSYKDGAAASNENLKLVNDLDIAVKLDKDGDLAVNFNRALNEVLTTLNDGNVKKLIEIYGEGILNLGESLKYKVDSRLANKLGLNTDAMRTSAAKFDTPTNAKNSWEFKEYTSSTQSQSVDISMSGSDIVLQNSGGVPKIVLKKSSEDKRLIYRNKSNLVDDYEINSTIAIGTNSGTGKSGVFFRAEDVDTGINGYSFEILHDGSNPYNNKLYLLKWMNGVPTTISTAGFSGSEYLHNGSIDLKVAVNGSQFTASIDGVKVLTYSDSTYTSGEIGMSYGKSIDGTLSNFAVTYASDLDNKIKLLQWAAANANAADKIDVYRNGNYTELLPESYNSKALCESLNAQILQNICALN